MTRAAASLALMTAAFVVAGCGSILSPRPDLSKFFVLTPATDATSAMPRTGNGPTIGLGPVRLPAYLDREEIATRIDLNQMQYSETDRWAEPLDTDFRRTLEKDLAAALGTAQIVPFPWFAPARPDYKIEVDVDRFERNEKGDSQLTSHWTIKDGKSGKLLFAKASDINHPAQSGGTEASVAALSTNVGELSDQIATAVRELEEKRR